jgi:hypothetical protein
VDRGEYHQAAGAGKEAAIRSGDLIIVYFASVGGNSRATANSAIKIKTPAPK